MAQDMMMAYVYRDYPPLIDVPEDVKQETHDYNYVDKLTVPLISDQDLNDRYGAGDFHIFLNVEVPLTNAHWPPHSSRVIGILNPCPRLTGVSVRWGQMAFQNGLTGMTLNARLMWSTCVGGESFQNYTQQKRRK